MSTTAVAPVAASIPLPVGRLASVGSVVFFANAALLVLQLVLDVIGDFGRTWRGEPPREHAPAPEDAAKVN